MWLRRGDGLLPPAGPESGLRAEPLQLLHCQLRPLQALMTAVRMGWMCMCHGDEGAGTSSVMRLPAWLHLGLVWLHLRLA